MQNKRTSYKYFVIPDQCLENIKNFDLDKQCMKKVLSRCLSLMVVSLSFVSKVPQIKKIINKQSAIGFTPTSIFTDVLSSLFNSGYFYNNDYPLMNYLEKINMLIQTLVIFQLVYRYKQMTQSQYRFYVTIILGLLIIVYSKMLPTFIVSMLLAIAISFYCFSRFVQIREIAKLKFSGSISIISTFLSFAGITSRTVTLFIDLKKDSLLLVMQLLQFLFASCLFFFTIFYRNLPKNLNKETKVKQFYSTLNFIMSLNDEMIQILKQKSDRLFGQTTQKINQNRNNVLQYLQSIEFQEDEFQKYQKDLQKQTSQLVQESDEVLQQFKVSLDQIHKERQDTNIKFYQIERKIREFDQNFASKFSNIVFQNEDVEKIHENYQDFRKHLTTIQSNQKENMNSNHQANYFEDLSESKFENYRQNLLNFDNIQSFVEVQNQNDNQLNNELQMNSNNTLNENLDLTQKTRTMTKTFNFKTKQRSTIEELDNDTEIVPQDEAKTYVDNLNPSHVPNNPKSILQKRLTKEIRESINNSQALCQSIKQIVTNLDENLNIESNVISVQNYKIENQMDEPQKSQSIKIQQSQIQEKNDLFVKNQNSSNKYDQNYSQKQKEKSDREKISQYLRSHKKDLNQSQFNQSKIDNNLQDQTQLKLQNISQKMSLQQDTNMSKSFSKIQKSLKNQKPTSRIITNVSEQLNSFDDDFDDQDFDDLIQLILCSRNNIIVIQIMFKRIIRNIDSYKLPKDALRVAQGLGIVASNFFSNNQNLKGDFMRQTDKYMEEKVFIDQNEQEEVNLFDDEQFKQLQDMKVVHPHQISQERKVPSSSLNRSAILGSTLASIASDYVYNSVKNTLSGSNEKVQIISDKNAEKLAETFCRMRGAALKLGQALSIQEERLIPEQIKKAFNKARSSAHKMPKWQLDQVLTKELGPNWKDNFKEFSENPFAAASIGQVHRCTMKDGTEAIIKIQYPGVAESIDSDLNSLTRIVNTFQLFPKNFFFDDFIYNTRRELKEECNYEIEAQKQIKYKKHITDLNLEKYYTVPEVIKFTKRVLVMQYKEGLYIDDIANTAGQKVRDYVGSLIMRITIEELFIMNFMQTDPNFSNFFFNQKDMKLILIDFGAATQYKKEFCDTYEHIIEAGCREDDEKVLEYGKDLGFLTGEENINMKESFCKSLIAASEPFKKDEPYDFAAQKITETVYVYMPAMMRNRLKQPPIEVYSLHRKLSGAYLMCIKLKAKVNVRKIFKEVLNQKNNQKKQTIFIQDLQQLQKN